jgi:hypothetical protein
MPELNPTHDPAARSWVASANVAGCDFPIQNLPSLFALLSDDAPPATQAAVQACLIPRSRAVYRVPSQVANYTDFYTSIHHARNVGKRHPARTTR